MASLLDLDDVGVVTSDVRVFRFPDGDEEEDAAEAAAALDFSSRIWKKDFGHVNIFNMASY